MKSDKITFKLFLVIISNFGIVLNDFEVIGSRLESSGIDCHPLDFIESHEITQYCYEYSRKLLRNHGEIA